MTWWKHIIEIVLITLRWLTLQSAEKTKKKKEIEDEIAKPDTGDPGRWTRIFERINRL